MGQEVCVKTHSGNEGVSTIPVESNSAGMDESSLVLFDQQIDDCLSIVEPFDTLSECLSSKSSLAEVYIRGLDIVGALILLIFAAPVMIFIAFLIKVSSAGPVLFKQYRVGKLGKIFKLYKFRTMVDGAEKNTGPVWAAKDDERVTPLGKILRRTRIDELPQLFNVLRGDMSLVGPRPERPYFVRQHRALQGVRLAVKPGITGLAQIRAFYNLRPEHKLKYDYLYIQNKSLLLNLYILLHTIPVVFLKKGW